MLIDIVYSAPRYLCSALERLPLSIQAFELGQQARADAADRAPNSLDKRRRQQTHITRETNQFHTSLFQFRCDLGIVLCSISPAAFYGECVDASFARLYQA